MSTTQGIRLDDKTQARLAALAELRDRSPHWLMRQAIEHFLDREEQYEKEKREDMAEWDDYVLTGRGVPAAKANAWLRKLASGKSAKCPK